MVVFAVSAGQSLLKSTKDFLQILLPTLSISFEIQCLFRILVASGHIGTRFYGALLYKFKKIVGGTYYYNQFRKTTGCMLSVLYCL